MLEIKEQNQYIIILFLFILPSFHTVAYEELLDDHKLEGNFHECLLMTLNVFYTWNNYDIQYFSTI